MNKVFNYIKLALVGLVAVGVASCNDEYEYTPVGAEAQTDGVYFATPSASEEIDPTAATSYAITVSRKDSTNAGTYKLNVLTNTDDAFNVPSTVSFAAGEATATVTVTFPKAGVGTTYTLKVAVDESETSPYAYYQCFTYKVTRVKWNDLGTAQFYDGFWYGFLTNVTLQQRDDDPTTYRVNNPFTNELVSAYGEATGTYTDFITFSVDEEDYISWNQYICINTTSSDYGVELLGWYPSSLRESIADYDENSKVVRDEETGDILYFDIEPYWYMTGVGGYGCYPIYIGMPGFDLTTVLPSDEEE